MKWLRVTAKEGFPSTPLCARFDARLDPQRAGFHSVHGRDEGALGRLPARVRMRLWCDGFRGGTYIAFVVMGAEWSRSGTRDPGPPRQ